MLVSWQLGGKAGWFFLDADCIATTDFLVGGGA